MVAVILATGVAFLSEYKSDREFEVLNAHKESLRVKVLRGGQFHTVPLEEVVVGDAVVLEIGDEIPADGRLVKATELYVDQSLMTGESEPVRKQAAACRRHRRRTGTAGLSLSRHAGRGWRRRDARHRGRRRHLPRPDRPQAVGRGRRGRGREAAADSEEQRVKRKLTISKELTPLQQKLKHLADLISKIGYVAAVADLPGPARARHARPARSTGRRSFGDAGQRLRRTCSTTSCTWSSSSSWPCPKGCR